MRPGDHKLAKQLEAGLLHFDQEIRQLPGIHDPSRREVLLEQMLESIRRIRYVSAISKRKISVRRADPNDELFDPLKATIIYRRLNQIDEAFWMVFLFVHFGKNARGGWRYAREIYSGLSKSVLWDWERISNNPTDFRKWLDEHQNELKREGVPGGFGNHRKFQSLDAYKRNGTGDAIESYVHWIGPPRTHQQLFDQALEHADGDPRLAFANLYRSMDDVASFGRLARFDYLTMIGKLGFASIEPGSTYLQNATGPFNGARLLFGNHLTTGLTPEVLDGWLIELDARINVGMQVLEDALCNWYKRPDEFKPFRG